MRTIEDLPKLLNTEQAAAFLGWHPEHVRKLAREGMLPAVKVRRQWRYYLHRLQAWIDAGCPSPQEQPSLFQEPS